jgi:Tfp pilus assembly protein FimT
MVIGACGVLLAVSVPFILSYHQSAQVTAGAQQVRSLLNEARQLAMDQKALVCVRLVSPTQISFYPNDTCSDPAWTGPISDATGKIN